MAAQTLLQEKEEVRRCLRTHSRSKQALMRRFSKNDSSSAASAGRTSGLTPGRSERFAPLLQEWFLHRRL